MDGKLLPFLKVAAGKVSKTPPGAPLPLLVADLPAPIPRLAPRPIGGIGLDVVGYYRAVSQVNASEVTVEHCVGG